MGTVRDLGASLLHLRLHFCTLCYICVSFWCPLAPFGHPWGTLGASVWQPWRHFGILGAPFVSSFVIFGRGPKKDRKRVEKGTKKNRIWEPSGSFFDDILSFCRKWQTAFGLRLRGRIGVGASCFRSLSLHWWPLFFQRFFNVFWGYPGT